MLSTITWWLLTPNAQWSSTTTCDVQLATSRGPHEGSQGIQGSGSWQPGFWKAISSTRPTAGPGNTEWLPSLRAWSRPRIGFLQQHTIRVHIPTSVGGGLLGPCITARKMLQGPADFTPPTSWPCAARTCSSGWWPVYSGSTTLPTRRPSSNVSWDSIYTLTRAPACH